MNKLFISFSGGRTSAVMTKMLWEEYRDTDTEVKIMFANTGCEHEETLIFVHRCEEEFGWTVNWVEAVTDPRKGVGVSYRVVDFKSASRNGEPFESVVSKYGIFNMTSPACTARLKTDVMRKFLMDQGYNFGKKLDHKTAIGIRADELDRISARADEYGFIYPLARKGITKRDVALEIKKWPFDLGIPNDAYGNCVWCWKKTHRKHLTLAVESPSVFDFPKRMEDKYSHVNGDTAAGHEGKRYWFRKHKTVDDIMDEAKKMQFVPYVDDPYDHGIEFDDYYDLGSGCGESCEVGADMEQMYLSDFEE